MKNKFLLILILLCSISIIAQVDRTKMPEPGPAPEIKLGDFDTFTLDNGLKVFVVENDKLPVISYSLLIDRDPILEGDNAGYVSIAGQLLQTGTTTRTKEEIDEAIDFLGASLSTGSAGMNGSSLKKHTNELLEIMSDVLLHPAFKQDEMDKIKKRIISGLKASKEDPNSIADNVQHALVYGLHHPYGEQLTEETVESVTLDMCKEYYNKYFSPSIAYLAIVGDINVKEAKELANKYFGSWSAKTVPTADYPAPKLPLTNKVALVDRPSAVQSIVHVTYPIDYKINAKDGIAVSVTNMILGGYFSSKLNSNLREDKAYTYGASSSIHPDEVIGNFDASAPVRNAVTDSAITEILKEMKNMREGVISDDELQLAKNYLIGSFSRSLESPQTIARFALNIERYGLPDDFYQNYLKNVSAITKQDIINAANKYLKPENAYIIVVGKGEEVAESLKKFSANNEIKYYDIYGNEYDPASKIVPDGVTAKSVLDKYINAMGGKKTLMATKDLEIILQGTIQGMDVTLSISQKAPNKLYQVLDAGIIKQVTVFNGEKGKQSANGQEMIVDGEQLEELKLQATLNLDLKYDELGITSELTGTKDVNGKDAYEIQLVYPSGKKVYHYYDPETGLRVREVSTVSTPQGDFSQTVDMEDYREVDGRMFPYKMTQNLGPQTIEMEVSSIKVNQGLDDSLFEIN